MPSKARAARLLQMALQNHKMHKREKQIECDISEQVIDGLLKTYYTVLCASDSLIMINGIADT